jgi:glycoside/pentoside/hexuronide:cation symporter, GPH family
VEAGALILAPAGAYAAGLLVARILDGVVDIPIAAWTDNLKSRWGRRRPLMVIGFIPTILSFFLLWYPPLTGTRLGADGHWGNALFVAVASSLYFFFHTLIIVPYLASLSEIVPDEESRVRVASWQTFFNTAGYVLTFVVAPMLFERFGVRGTIWLLAPVFISFLGPILVIKETSTEAASADSVQQGADVPLWESVKMTLGNRTFRIYMLSVATFFFGLQFFLGGIAFMAVDMMGLTEGQLGLDECGRLCTCTVHADPVQLAGKKERRQMGFPAGLLVFAVAMLMFPLGWTQLNLPIPPFLVGVIAGGVGSFSIGVFFTIPYAFPAQIAANDAQKTGKDRAGMYFAVQGVINQFMGGLAGSILALLLNWRFGAVAVGPIVALTCVLAFFFFAPYPLGQPKAKAPSKT